MAFVQNITGTTLVELGGVTKAIGKRELGELRTIAAEMKRESYTDSDHHGRVSDIHEQLISGQMSLEQLQELEQSEFNESNDNLPGERTTTATQDSTLPPESGLKAR